MIDDTNANVRLLVDDVTASVDYYTRHFGFEVLHAFPAFADVQADTSGCSCRVPTAPPHAP